ncbi:DJ-1/PfpI family protein [Xylariomycetidae sp. FL2044]|nr:DJ-1/PfpI family protein [Xylariomycetidae sp. FL2044]
MYLLSTFAGLLSATAALTHQARTSMYPLVKHQVTTNETTTPPRNIGVVLYRAFVMQDVIGVTDPLQLLAFNFPMNLYFLAETLDPVTTEPAMAGMNAYNSSFFPTLTPTHTFADAPADLDVLIVPGGPGVRSPSLAPVANFIARAYPGLKYLLTVCTGAGVAASSGVLDGRRATTNKGSWEAMKAMGPDVTWVSPARWVVDGNIWSSAGVTAGSDMTMAWIKEVWGSEWAEKIENIQEYQPHAQDFDPWSAKYNITPTG